MFRYLLLLLMIILCFANAKNVSAGPSADYAAPFSFESLYKEADVVPEAMGKVVRAKRTHGAVIIVDGKLNEKAWNRAEEIYDFVQSRPDYGFAPTEQTEFKVLYDNKAIYIGVRAYDSEPDKIMGQLTRRDEFSDSDWLTVYIDSRFDRTTSYNFSVNPFGVKVDFYMYNDQHMDKSWDAVWDCQTTIDSLGWTAEFKIPYSVLRFSSEERMMWGFNIRRTIKRKQEHDYWVLRPRGQSGVVSRFGLLVGLAKIAPPRRLEILPYAVGRAGIEKNEGSNRHVVDTFYNMGTDVKYGLGPGVTLDATINPDFGQVEDDPSVLNLSVFETFFPERRPFFLEGSQEFAMPFMLFHSRRIGKKPGRFKISSNNEEISRPDFTTILGAAKVTGKTNTGATFSILNAVTDQEFAVVDSVYKDEQTGEEVRQRKDQLVEPYSNYFVGRVRQDMLWGASYIGAMATSVNRRNSESDYTGGIDWQIRTPHNGYDFDGQMAYSLTGENNKTAGYATYLSARRISGKYFHAGTELEVISPDFDINDIGFLRQNNRIDLSGYIVLQQLDYYWIFRRMSQMIRFSHARNFDGLVTRRALNFRTMLFFRNFWSVFLNVRRSLSDYDDLETRGGPVIRDPAGSSASLRIESDDRKPIGINFGASYSKGNSGGWSRGVHLSMSFKPTSFFWLDISPRYSWGMSNSQWVKNIDDNDDGIMDHFVFGELNRHIFDLRLRTNLTLTRDLSMQFYMQPYVATGKYLRFKEFVDPGTYNFSPYTFDDPDFDFNKKTLKSNAVLRWEYRPGSTLFLVWTQSKNDNEYPGDFNLQRDFERSFLGAGRNIFLLKVNYWFNI